MFCLVGATDPEWAKEAVEDLDAVLIDHAHCEMKAATNALSLVVRHPGDLALVRALTDLAREELDHFRRCVDFLDRRGLRLGAPPVDTYAAELRRAASLAPASTLPPIVDRLLVGALIEARSCERFKLLLAALPARCSGEMRAFYEELFACEARHYRTYVDLAIQAASRAEEDGGDACRRADARDAGERAGAGGRGTRAASPIATAGGAEAAIEARLAWLAEREGGIVKALATRDRRATVHG